MDAKTGIEIIAHKIIHRLQKIKMILIKWAINFKDYFLKLSVIIFQKFIQWHWNELSGFIMCDIRIIVP